MTALMCEPPGRAGRSAQSAPGWACLKALRGTHGRSAAHPWTVGGSVVVDTDNDTLIVVRVDDAPVVALSAVCTHSGCICDYAASASQIVCDCHGSRFTLAGGVVRGPARRPLHGYAVALGADDVTVTVA